MFSVVAIYLCSLLVAIEQRTKHCLDTLLYEQDAGKSSGISMVPKLTYEHLHLTSFSKMRVDLAAQVCAKFVLQK